MIVDITPIIAEAEKMIKKALESSTSAPESLDDVDGLALCYTFSILLFLVRDHGFNQADKIKKATSGIYAVLKKQGDRTQDATHATIMMVQYTYKALTECNRRYECIERLLLRKINEIIQEFEGSYGQPE